MSYWFIFSKVSDMGKAVKPLLCHMTGGNQYWMFRQTHVEDNSTENWWKQGNMDSSQRFETSFILTIDCLGRMERFFATTSALVGRLSICILFSFVKVCAIGVCDKQFSYIQGFNLRWEMTRRKRLLYCLATRALSGATMQRRTSSCTRRPAPVSPWGSLLAAKMKLFWQSVIPVRSCSSGLSPISTLEEWNTGTWRKCSFTHCYQNILENKELNTSFMGLIEAQNFFKEWVLNIGWSLTSKMCLKACFRP